MPTRKLRIASFTYSTRPRGGVIHSLSLAENLQVLGHEVHIFALSKEQQGFFRPTSVPHTLIPFENPGDHMLLDQRIQLYIQTYYEFMTDHLTESFDIYHVQDCVSANAVWRLRENGLIPSFIRTVHHIDDFTTPTLIQCQNDSVYRPDQRIVVSHYWQRRLHDEFGVDSQVIHNGVDLERFGPPSEEQRHAARAELGLQNQLVILNIGGIEPRKNTIRLVKAFEEVHKQLAAQEQAAVLLLAGGETLLDHTPYRVEFFDMLEHSTLQLNKDIVLLGTVADDRIPGLYHVADMLAFPSLKEGWGLVVLEALASGLPVLTSDLPVFREYLVTDTNALLVNPLSEAAIAAGIMCLSHDRTRCQRLAANGLQTAAKFSWRQTAIAHDELYQKSMLQR
ncbi:MAG: MSMEG_0565 family glycosyltransferase [Chloroflexi bacterium]|nr:MSMEG_0565 family glycosyltransferase [Chloroflexota bacterium]